MTVTVRSGAAAGPTRRPDFGLALPCVVGTDVSIGQSQEVPIDTLVPTFRSLSADALAIKLLFERSFGLCALKSADLSPVPLADLPRSAVGG